MEHAAARRPNRLTSNDGENLGADRRCYRWAVFVLTQLTGSDIDEQAAQTIGTALALLLFYVFGSAGSLCALPTILRGNGGTAAGITSLLALASAATCVLMPRRDPERMAEPAWPAAGGRFLGVFVALAIS